MVWITGILTFIVLFALLLNMWPAASDSVAKVFKTTGQKVRAVAQTVIGVGVGLILVSFGVTALAVAPIVGVVLIVIGLVLAGWTLYPLFNNGPQKPAGTKLGSTNFTN